MGGADGARGGEADGGRETEPTVPAERIKPAEPAEPAEPEGGEPACLLHRVCPECGRFAEQPGARRCVQCGTALDPDERAD